MLSIYERAFLSWLAANKFLGDGLIVELGAFTGTATVALATGLTMNQRLRNRPIKPWIRVYDRFRCGVYEAEFLSRHFPGIKYLPGRSFAEVFNEQVHQFNEFLDVREGDIREKKHDGQEIEILFVDAMKNPELASHIALEFMPFLPLGRGILVQQDFVHYYTSWIHLLMHRLRGSFRFVYHVPKSASAVFYKTEQPDLHKVDLHSLTSCADSEVSAAFCYSRSLIKGEMVENIDAAEAMHYIHIGRLETAIQLVEGWIRRNGTPRHEMKEVIQILKAKNPQLKMDSILTFLAASP